MPEPQSTLQLLIHALLQRDPPRAKSLSVTLLGDAIGPHGGNIWLSDLIDLVTPLGINERLLRTSVFRLVAQDWLQSERHGRRSLYRLSESGQELTAAASERIYVGSRNDWNGDWTLVILPRFGNSSLDGRGALRRELVWAGFGAIAPGIFALPRNQTVRARKVLAKLKVTDKALILSAHDMNKGQGLLLGSLVSQCWDLENVAQQYRQFSDTFAPMLEAIDGHTRPMQAFAVRALTIHEWRRIVLHDPQLPQQMLPVDWPGHAARELCGKLYWKVFDLAEEHLNQVIQRDPSHFQALKPHVYQRFGNHSPRSS
ncbi:phenylacetic acid degradation operon negative regulatory protein PaaX [Paralcaligenes sp. KSB-10]|uniref:phenylacetic acid degradation operon negative regulatory protein PaaX n=1 Tax=Paralcaligenes sp. KSB-10 TaxID=2901142 RepID=UPI001E5BEFD4|nr:phenylacetic acid degradation operon negative regulatory protein PaaX [Paralcaligenes sp. KSB-10]UHL65160.1 phenylacetic acid degradation operon negative regulatory protein PaaX [Paralcaligenes sp. KSB-10]